MRKDGWSRRRRDRDEEEIAVPVMPEGINKLLTGSATQNKLFPLKTF